MNQDLHTYYEQFVASISYSNVQWDAQLLEREIGRDFRCPNISLVVLMRDEERCIGRCLASLSEQIRDGDEIVVIDTGSKDKSIEIVKSDYGNARLLNFVWRNDFAAARNFGIASANCEYVFFIDADEELFEGSLEVLRRHLIIIELLQINSLVIRPTIKNDNGHVVHGTDRILKRDSGGYYAGSVHECLRFQEADWKQSVNAIAFDNVLLLHDGYREEIVAAKRKIGRNLPLLDQMIRKEPDNPRWRYLRARDSRGYVRAEMCIEDLLKVLELVEGWDHGNLYRIRALSDLTDLYMERGSFTEAKGYLNRLIEETGEDFADVVYFRASLKIIDLYEQAHVLIKYLRDYRLSRETPGYGSAHSGYFHIDELLSRLLFMIGDSDKALAIRNRLLSRGFLVEENRDQKSPENRNRVNNG